LEIPNSNWQKKFHKDCFKSTRGDGGCKAFFPFFSFFLGCLQTLTVVEIANARFLELKRMSHHDTTRPSGNTLRFSNLIAANEMLARVGTFDRLST
jgi:hypothetical protein